MSVDPTCPMVHLCLFLETGWVLTLPPYHPTSVRQDSYLLLVSISAPEVLGCYQACTSSNIQEPECELLRCVPQRVVHSPSWASLLIRVDCQLKPFTGPSCPHDPIQQPWILSYTLRQPSRASCAGVGGWAKQCPSREGLSQVIFLSQKLLESLTGARPPSPRVC